MAGHRRFLQGKDKRMWRTAAAAAALVVTALLAARPVAAQKPADEVFRARAAISLPNGQKVTSFDISYDDPALGLYFLADRTNKAVDVVDVQTNQVVEQLTANFAGIVGSNFDQAGPNGILTVEHRFLWAGDFGSGLGGLVKVIDLTNGSLVATINTGGTARADELCYDPVDHVILIANDAEPLPPSGAGPYVTFINSQTYQVLGRIFMNGQNGSPLATNGIEQCQWSRKTDKFYLNIPEVNGPGTDAAPGAVLVIHPTKMKIVKTFNIPHNQCEGPQGMAIGPENQILLGCNDPLKTCRRQWSSICTTATSFMSCAMRTAATRSGSTMATAITSSLNRAAPIRSISASSTPRPARKIGARRPALRARGASIRWRPMPPR